MPENGWNEWSRHVLAEMKRLNDCIERIEQRLSSVDEWSTQSKTRWREHEREHEREGIVLKVFSTAVAMVSSTMAAIFAWFTR